VAGTSDYPEHDKLLAVADQTQAAGEFMEWLAREKGFVVASFVERHGHYLPVKQPLEMLLAEWQGIDPIRLEQEKAHMLRMIREADRGA
jgi:hypothetical protein